MQEGWRERMAEKDGRMDGKVVEKRQINEREKATVTTNERFVR